MKQTEVKTDRQTTHRIFDRICGHGTGCIALQPDKDLVRSRVSWPNVATDKRLYVVMDKGIYIATGKGLYVPTRLSPDKHTAGWQSGKLRSPTDCQTAGWTVAQPDCRTTKRINNRITVRTSLRMCLRLSRFNNLIFNL
jgi:hypothetical protein